LKFQPHAYQVGGINFLKDNSHRGAALLLDPGHGKTAMCLTWILDKDITPIIVAPPRVVQTVWRQEAAKWDDFKGMKIVAVEGTPKERIKLLGIPADAYLISCDQMKWLLENRDLISEHVNGLIVDESTKFKTWKAQRTKALVKLSKTFGHKVILTGTPVPNTLCDLYAQMYICDDGDSLGKYISHFHKKYFYQGGFKGYDWLPQVNAKERIEEAVRDRCYRIEGGVKLPDLTINDIIVQLPKEAKATYSQLHRDMMASIDGEDFIASNAGAKYGMCRQVANGALYSEDGYNTIHDEKIKVVDSLLEDLNGKPLLVAYQFRHDLSRLQQAFGKRMKDISGATKGKDAAKIIEDWNAGKIQLLTVQPQSLSHGVNMQGCGTHIAWFGLTNNLETYIQFNARLYRQGVTGAVTLHRILADKTVDLAIRETIERKDVSQKSILEALRRI